MKRRYLLVSLAPLAVLSALAQQADAAPGALYAEPFEGRKVRVDGMAKEWRLDFAALKVTVSGKDGSDPRARGNVGYDDKHVYVAMDVRDADLVRTSSAGQNEDHAELVIAFPRERGGFATYTLSLYPGEAGKTAGAVKMQGKPVAGASLVEAATEDGYVFEAQIPWSAFPESSLVRVGLRAALRLYDHDPGGRKTVIATAAGTAGKDLPPLLLEAEQGIEMNLVRQKNLRGTPDRLELGNVAGDAQYEAVALYGPVLTIAGARYREGKQFYFGDLGVKDARQVTRLELVDVDGDGRQEILIRKRLGSDESHREVLQIIKVAEDGTPFDAFVHEVGVRTPSGKIANEVTLEPHGKGRRIRIGQGATDGIDPDAYDEPEPGDMPSALMPWDTVKSRTFEWTGSAFQKVDEQSHKPKLVRSDKAKSRGSVAIVDAPPPPRPPTADELLDKVYALYRKDRGVDKAVPRFDFVTDVVADRANERVLVHQRDIVVFGKGFLGGTSYAYTTIGVADPTDILDVTARDLTGDGKAEVVVRAVLHAKASEELGGEVVDRHALFVYKVLGDRVLRVFAAETGRTLGQNHVIGAVSFGAAPTGSIELRAARAIGWSERSYPFPEDVAPAGGLEPVLLPWGTQPNRKYRFNGQAFTAE